MKKRIFTLLVPVCMIACSQDSNVSPVGGDISEASIAELGTPLPYFFFGEDGARYSRDAKSGELVKKEMNRTELVVANEEAFDFLKAEYRARENKGLEYPVNYLCRSELLAINAEYSKVVTEDGKVLLDDALLFKGCDDISKEDALMRRTEYTNFPESRTYTRFPVRIIGSSYIEKVGSKYEAGGRLNCYSYENGYGFMPYQPRYGKLITFSFKKNACTGSSVNELWCPDFVMFPMFLIDGEAETGGTANGWTSYSRVANVSKHVVIHGIDTVVFRTSINVSADTAARIYDSRLSNSF